jgi:hypothetical protein
MGTKVHFFLEFSKIADGEFEKQIQRIEFLITAYTAYTKT